MGITSPLRVIKFLNIIIDNELLVLINKIIDNESFGLMIFFMILNKLKKRRKYC